MSKWGTPIFTTGQAAKIVGVATKTLINYDNWGLFSPGRSHSARRLYSRQDIYEIMAIRYLLEYKKLTIKGVKFALELLNLAMEKGVDLREEILPAHVREQIEENIP